MQTSKSERVVLNFGEVPGGLEMAVRSLGCSVQAAGDAGDVFSFLREPEVEIAVLVIVVTANQGHLDVLREIRAMDANLPIIIVGDSYSSTRDVVAAVRIGATDFLCKPIAHEELVRVLTNAMETRKAPKTVMRNGALARIFKSANSGIREIESQLGQIGGSGVPVLIQGETGSGKEVLARELHARSARANRSFLKLNCAALPSELVESELFGYERGAFTGAFEKKPGVFELADGGTILLDEIGDMDIRLQAKLLQVLQDQEFRRIGGRETVRVNVRIIAATHRDLEKAIHDRAFREDLYYRLSVIVLRVPALRERAEDIVPLGEFLIRKYVNAGDPIPSISADLRNAMKVYDWPGNVRELENYMRKLVVFRDPEAIAGELQLRTSSKSQRPDRAQQNQVVPILRGDNVAALEKVTKNSRDAEAAAILAALDSTRWNRKQAAAVLKTDYKSLLYKIKKLGIEDDSVSPERPISEPVRSPRKSSNG